MLTPSRSAYQALLEVLCANVVDAQRFELYFPVLLGEFALRPKFRYALCQPV